MTSYKMNILYQFSETYAPFAGISITSLLMNNQGDIHFFLLTPAIGTADLQKIQDTIESFGQRYTIVETTDLDEKLTELDFPKYRGSYTTNYKLFIADLITSDVERILYIDSDTVVTGDISELFEMDMGDHCVAMVTDSICNNVKILKGFQKEDYYCNAGVILFNIPVWNAAGIEGKIVAHLMETHERYASPDQDLINLIVGRDILKLHPRYNLQPLHYAYSDKTYFNYYHPVAYYSAEEIQEARNHPAIMHTFRFIGEYPWHKGNVHPQVSFFDEYLRKSQWSDYQKSPSDIGRVHKMEKVLYKILPRSLYLIVFNFYFNRYFKELIRSVKSGEDSD